MAKVSSNSVLILIFVRGNFKTINEIAIELGYGKPGHFATIYKKQFGQLPGEVFKKSTS